MTDVEKWLLLGFVLMASVLVITCALLRGGNRDNEP